MPGRSVDEDERCSGALLAIEIGVVFTRRHDDDPVDTPVAKGTDQLAFAKWVLVAAPGEDENAPSACCVLDRTMECRGERVRDVLQDEPDRLRLAAKPSQHRRIGVAAIVELRDRSPNLRFQSRTDPGSSLTTRETVLRPTPASAATSSIVGRRGMAVGGFSDNEISPFSDNKSQGCYNARAALDKTFLTTLSSVISCSMPIRRTAVQPQPYIAWTQVAPSRAGCAVLLHGQP